jgi:transcriptional regulator with XRE-family HTH domain
MADTTIQRRIRAQQRTLRRRVGEALLDLREERGLSVRTVAEASGLDRRWLARAEAGDANLSIDALSAFATVLGAEASIRLFEAAGPRLKDHIQVRLIDTLAARLHARWELHLEVPVYRPARGVIDLVLVERTTRELVAGEGHSEIRRVERQLRWAAEKADSLPSADGWPWGTAAAPVGRLLLLRSTSVTRAVVQGAAHLFTAAYPGSTAAAVEALCSAGGRFPGAAIVWVDARGSGSRLLDGPPRGVSVGR